MIPITGTASRLQAFCGSAVTTDVKFTVGYLNMLSQTGITTTGQRGTQIRTVSDGVTDVQIAPYPGQSAISSTITSGQNNYTQNVFYVKAYNSNAGSVTVTIQIEDGSDDIQIKATLLTLETLSYEDGQGWYATDANGARKTNFTAYSESVWTPTDASGAGLAFTSPTGTWEKIGRQVTARFALTYPVTVDGSTMQIGGLPFTVSNNVDAQQGFISYSDETTAIRLIPSVASTTFNAYTSAGVSITNATMSGNVLRGTLIYYV